jgi:beta-lactamase class A
MRRYRQPATGRPRPLQAVLAAIAAMTLFAVSGAASQVPWRAGPTAPAGVTQTMAVAHISVTGRRRRLVRSAAPVCVSPARKYRKLAARMSRGITRALSGRTSVVGLAVADSRTNIRCEFHQGTHFHSASVVKVLILAALLHELTVMHQPLGRSRAALTTAMITRSDNAAASTLWQQVGRWRLQHFLHLTKMTHTTLGPGPYWGLTLITAHDELILLKQLKSSQSVLGPRSRSYALSLMARVIAAQRWGVPAGAPRGVTVHVKNGWLPDPVSWVINSIGVFTARRRNYRIAVLTRGNPSMPYGIATVQGVAEVINRDLNPGTVPANLPAGPFPSWGVPDEPIPPRTGRS